MGLARKLESEGHSAPMFIDTPDLTVGAGIVKRIVTPRPLRDKEGIVNVSTLDYLINQAKPEIVIFDYVAPRIITDHIAKQRLKIIGSDPALPAGTRPTSADKLIAVDGWFNGQDIVGPFGYHVLYTRSIPGGKGFGPVVPATAVLSQYSFHRINAFKEIEAQLRSTSYRGPVTGYIAPTAPAEITWQGGFTECTPNLTEVLYTPISQFLVSIVNTAPSKLTLSANYSASIRVTAQLWPAPSHTSGLRLPGFNEHNLKHAWPTDLLLKDGMFQSSDRGSGDIALLIARGNYLREATRRLIRTIKNVAVPEMQYRFDVLDDIAHCHDAEKIFSGLLTSDLRSSKVSIGVAA